MRGPGSLFGWLLRRKTASFDFTMLGPRVPAVVVSPCIAAGKVDDTVRDHASVPATLRAVFAPDASPLTRRDAWSYPFHTLANLDQPRRGSDMPDLSGYVRRQPDDDRLFLASASARPGGGVHGGPGANAARAALPGPDGAETFTLRRFAVPNG